MKDKVISSLPIIVWRKARLNTENSMLVTSPSALKLGRSYFAQKIPKNILHITNSDYAYVQGLVARKPKNSIDTLYLLGGGQVIDVGRYLAYKWHVKAVAIPTIISTDAFLVDCTGLRKDGCVTYVESKKADRVILDWNLISKTPWRFQVSGCGDVLSIFTGLYDWAYANRSHNAEPDEIYDKSLAMVAESILKGLLENKEVISSKSKEGIEKLVEALALEVQLCYFYGNSRPEEGGEHFFTYCIENLTDHFLHGEMVGFSTLLTGFLQGQDITKILNFMSFVDMPYFPQGLTKKLVIKTLRELPQYVEKHSLRYSVYNNFEYMDKQKDVDSFFEIICMNA